MYVYGSNAEQQNMCFRATSFVVAAQRQRHHLDTGATVAAHPEAVNDTGEPLAPLPLDPRIARAQRPHINDKGMRRATGHVDTCS